MFNHHRLRHHCRGAGGEETAGGCGRDGSRACRDEGPAEGPSQRLWHSREWQSVRRRNRAAEEAHPGWQDQAPVASAEVGAVAQAGRWSAARLSLRAPDTSTLCTPGMPPSTLCTSGTSMGQQMPAANTLVVRSAAALAGAAGCGGRPPPEASSASAPAVEVGPSTSRPCCSLGEPGVRLPRGRGRKGQARWGGAGHWGPVRLRNGGTARGGTRESECSVPFGATDSSRCLAAAGKEASHLSFREDSVDNRPWLTTTGPLEQRLPQQLGATW